MNAFLQILKIKLKILWLAFSRKPVLFFYQVSFMLIVGVVVVVEYLESCTFWVRYFHFIGYTYLLQSLLNVEYTTAVAQRSKKSTIRHIWTLKETAVIKVYSRIYRHYIVVYNVRWRVLIFIWRVVNSCISLMVVLECIFCQCIGWWGVVWLYRGLYSGRAGHQRSLASSAEATFGY